MEGVIMSLQKVAVSGYDWSTSYVTIHFDVLKKSLFGGWKKHKGNTGLSLQLLALDKSIPLEHMKLMKHGSMVLDPPPLLIYKMLQEARLQLQRNGEDDKSKLLRSAEDEIYKKYFKDSN